MHVADKIQQGVASIPTGIYQVSATLNDATTGALLGTGSHSVIIQTASTIEAIINLTSPATGDQVPESPSVVFIFDTSIPGRLLAFEHSSFSQSPQDAVADLNSPLKVFDINVTQPGSKDYPVISPGIATRPWMAGKKFSWYFLGSYPNSTDTKSSAINTFVVIPSDPIYRQLVAALTGVPDPIGSTYSNLISSGYTLNLRGRFSFQGGDNASSQQIDATRLLSLLSDLARRQPTTQRWRCHPITSWMEEFPMKRSLPLFVIIIIAALLAAPAWNFQDKKPIAAYIMKVVNNVERRSSSTTGWTKALLLSELKAGYEVRTQEKSFAMIKFADDSKVAVREKSIITISGEVQGGKILNRDVYISVDEQLSRSKNKRPNNSDSLLRSLLLPSVERKAEPASIWRESRRHHHYYRCR